MKTLYFLALLLFSKAGNSQYCAKQGTIVKETSDTIYIEMSVFPHHCDFDSCEFEGKFYFIPCVDPHSKWAFIEKVHFYHPTQSYDEISDRFEKIWKKVTI